MLTVLLAPVDRSQCAGSEEMSNLLRKASSKWAEGSAPMASSCSGSAPGRKGVAPPSGGDPLSGLACPLVRHPRPSLTPRSLERGYARMVVFLV